MRVPGGSSAVFEAPTLVAGLDDFAVVGQAIEQRGGHLGITEHPRPFAEGEIGGDDDGGALVEPADQMEEQLAAGLREGQVAEFVEHDEIHAGEVFGEPALSISAGFVLQAVDEVDDGVERPRAAPRMQARAMAMAKWLLPVPVPPTSTALRGSARKAPPARSRISLSLTGVPAKSKSKSSTSLASGNLAMVS